MKNYLLSLFSWVVIKKVVSSFIIAAFVLTTPLQIFAQQVSSSSNQNISDSTTQDTTSTDSSAGDQGSSQNTETQNNNHDDDVTINDAENTVDDSEALSDDELQTNNLDSMSEEPDAYRDISRDVVSSLKVEPELQTGAMHFEFPIGAAPGRNDMTPDLKLSYTSQPSTQVNLYGYGWSDNIPYIERLNKTGTEKLYSDNYFTSSLDGELKANASVATTSYGAKVENGAFNKYEFLTNNKWLVTDKSGTTYKFGYATSSQLYDTASSTRIYKWMLEEVRDRNDNYIKYEYIHDSNQVYPSKIIYTGNGSTDGIFEIEFIRESRPDIATSSITNFNVVSSQRISEIQAKINGSWVKKYELDYATSSESTRSLLKQIIETGKDESSNIIILPATHFTYATSTKSFTESSAWALPERITMQGGDNGVRLVDINGDSLPDVIKARDSYGSVTEQKSYLNNGNGWATTSNFSSPVGLNDYQTARDKGVRLADINGDGLVDIVKNRDIYINNGSGWTLSSTWISPEDIVMRTSYDATPSYDNGVRFVDLNGDGLTDITRSKIKPYIQYVSGHMMVTEVYEKATYLNTGTGWASTTLWISPEIFADADGKDIGIRFADINGDGLTDMIDGRYPGGRLSYLNTGSGWATSTSSWESPVSFGGGDYEPRLYDINADNLMDVVSSLRDFTWTDFKNVYLNKLSSFGSNDTSWPIPNIFRDIWSRDLGVQFDDVNGDGVGDIVNGADTESSITWLNNTKKADLLIKIDHGQGAVTNITYKASAQYKNGSTLLNPNLPRNIDTVEKIEVNDGLGNTITNQYVYEGGLDYIGNPIDRKFAGFQKVTKYDSAGNTVKTFYHQASSTDSTNGESTDSWAKIGKPYRVEVADSSGNIYSKTINNWATSTLANGREYVYLAKKTDLTYDGDSDHKDKAEEYSYNVSNGNLSQKISWGEVWSGNDGGFTDTGSDKFTTTISYATSTTYNIYRIPSQETTVDQYGTKINETKHYYDTQSFGSVTKGNETRTEQWKSGSSYASTTKSYNSYGLVTQSTDPRGKSTNYSYDVYNIYVATSTNPLNQTTSYLYDYSLGKPKQVTDSNGLVFQTIYDGVDRVKEEKQPDLSTPSTLVTKATYSYVDSGMPRMVQKTSYLNSATTTSSYTYMDGLGRPTQERKQAEENNVYSIKDTIYNSLGLKLKESLPYFSAGASTTAATTTPALFSIYSYDPVQRIKSVINSVGETTYSSDDWMTHIEDARHKAKNLYTDAYNNLIKVDEIDGSTGYATEYRYNGLGNLTKIIDALGNVREFTYDGLGRRLTSQDLHATSDTTFGSTTFAYDDAGNLTQKVDAKNQIVNYTYDDLNRPSTEDYTGNAGTEITYGYDTCLYGKGKLCSATTTDAISNYEYNALGLQSKETKRLNSINYVTQTSYDRLGNISTLIYPDNSQVLYTYNNAGLTESISRKENSTATTTPIVLNFDYSPLGQVTYQVNGNGTETTNTYNQNQLYRLVKKVTTTPQVLGMRAQAESLELISNPEEVYSDQVFKQINVVPVVPTDVKNENSEAKFKGYDSVGNATYESKVFSNKINAKSNNRYEPINLTLQSNKNDWSVKGNGYTAILGKTQNQPLITFINGSLELAISPLNSKTLTGTKSSSANKITYKDALGSGIDIISEVRDESVVKDVEIKTLKSLGNLSKKDYYEISFKLTSNKAIDIIADGKMLSKEGSITTTNAVEVTDNRSVSSYIMAPRAVDSSESSNRDRLISIPVTYTLSNGEIILTKKIPTSWLINAQYPVKADFVISSASLTNDGNVNTSPYPASWSTQHSDTNGRDVNTTDTEFGTLVESYDYNGGYLNIRRGFMAFDLTSLPSNASITAANLNLYTKSKQNAFDDGSDYITVYPSYQASTTLANSDIDACGNAITNPTKGSNDIDITNLALDTYQAFTLNSTGIAALSTSTISKLCIREGHDASDTPAVWNGLSWRVSGASFASADATGTTTDPYLGVTYSLLDLPPTAPTSLLANGQISPTDVDSSQLSFNAVFNDPATNSYAADIGGSYQIQVSNSSSNWSSPIWDSGKQTLSSSTPHGVRSPSITYTGPTLALDNSTYYWRIKFWDVSGQGGAWSTETRSFTTIQDTTSDGIQDISYEYDAVGNITRIVDMSSTNAAKIAVYTYDDLNRLTQAQITANSITNNNWYNPSWNYRIAVTASSTKVLEDTKDVYINLSALPGSFFTNTKSNGCDIRVTKADGTTELPIDLASFGGGAGQLFFNTGSNLSVSTSTIYYIYYGNAAASCYSANATYGAQNVYDSNTKGVWHLEQNSASSGAIIDSTANAHHGTMYSNYTNNANGTTTGKLGSAAVFDGANDTIDVPDSSDFENNSQTIEAWVYMDTSPSVKGENEDLVVKKHSSSPWRSYVLTMSQPDNRTDGSWNDSSGTAGYAGTYAGSTSANAWHYVVLRHDAANTSAELSVKTDGSAANTYTANTIGTTFNSNDVLRFGADYAGGNRLDGNMDEIRIHNAARSDNYLTTRYNNFNSPSTFWSVGTPVGASTTGTTTTTSYTENYSYNILGNFLSKTGQGSYAYSGTTTGSYANPHAATSIGGVTYNYDRNGNLASTSAGFTNTWDYRNRLTQTVVSSTTTYGYDHTDQRVKKTTGAVSMYYPNMYFNTTGATTTKHIFDNSGSMIANIEGSNASTTVHYIHPDHLGSASVVTNSSGQLEQLTDYYPYGTVRLDEKTSSFNEQRGYTGHEFDDESGLNYMNARYYDGRVGRFVSQDPVFLAVGNNNELKNKTGLDLQQYLSDPQSLNSYAYARNNPLIYVDQNGEFPGITGLLPQSTQVSLGNWANNYASQNSAFNYVTSHEWVANTVGGVGIAAGGGAAILYGGSLLGIQALQTLGSTCVALCSQAANRAQTVVDYSAKFGDALGGKMNQVYNQVSNKGYDFSEHAVQRISERGINPSSVINTLQNSKPFQYFNDGAMKNGYYDSASKLFVGQLQSTGKITTVINNVSSNYISNLIKTVK